MIRRPPRSTRTDTLFPYTTLFRSYLLTSTSTSSKRIALLSIGRNLGVAAGQPVRGADGLIGRVQIGRAHVCIPVTNAHLVCRLLLAKQNSQLLHQIIFSSLSIVNDDHDTLHTRHHRSLIISLYPFYTLT